MSQKNDIFLYCDVFVMYFSTATMLKKIMSVIHFAFVVMQLYVIDINEQIYDITRH